MRAAAFRFERQHRRDPHAFLIEQPDQQALGRERRVEQLVILDGGSEDLDAVPIVVVLAFEAGIDKLGLGSSQYAAIGAALDSSEFRANAGGVAADANDFILYDSATGSLFYDADGNAAGAKVLLGNFIGLTGTLDASDFSTQTPPLA